MTQVVSRSQKSTTVRALSSPPAVRVAFKALDRLAPALGARWAERIWFELPRPRTPPPVRNGEPGARFTVSVNGGIVAGETWGSGPVIYLVHGWAGHRGQLAAFVAPLVERGHRVVAFDAPSHGESGSGAMGPRSSSIVEFADALTAVVSTHGPARAIVAHSLGTTAAAAAMCDGLRVGRVAMLAPMASPRSFAAQFARMLGFGERTMGRLVTRIERRIGVPISHFDVPELGRAVAMPPTLIVHDRDDTSIPVSDGAAIAAAWPTARLRVTAGLGHRKVLRDPEVVAEVVEFVTTN